MKTLYTTYKDTQIEDLILQGAECSGHELACEQLRWERSINQQSVHAETLCWQWEAGECASTRQGSAPGMPKPGDGHQRPAMVKGMK